MFELISLISIVLAIAALSSARGVRARFETEVEVLKRKIEQIEATGRIPAENDASAMAMVEPSDAVEASASASASADGDIPLAKAVEDVPEPVLSPEKKPEQIASAIEPLTVDIAETATPEPAAVDPVPESSKPQRESFESQLAARWTVWVGGVALAFAGIFAVKYSIDQGLLSPDVRLSLAALFGLVLMAVGEWVRRRTTPLVENQFQNALIPGILTAAGAVTVMGAIFVAHAFYGYIGATVAFLLLAAVSLATLGLSLLHGQGLAGLGLLASFITPALVSSENPSPWSLFGFLTVAWLGSILASRLRDWRVAPAIANTGLSLWALGYPLAVQSFSVAPPVFPMLVMIAGLALLWPGRIVALLQPEPELAEADAPEAESETIAADSDSARIDALMRLPPRTASPWERYFVPQHIASTLTAAIGVMLVAIVLVAPDLQSDGQPQWGMAALVIALGLFGAWRTYAIYPAVFAALAAMGSVRIMTLGAASGGFNSGAEGAFVPATDPMTVQWLALGLGVFLAALGIAVAFRSGRERTPHASTWAVIGTVTPLALGAFSFIFFGNYAFDGMHGLYAILLGGAWLATAELVFRDPRFAHGFVFARDLFIAASWAAFMAALIVMTNDLATTLGAAFLGFAYLMGGRVRAWAILPWGMAASAIFVAGRIAWEPTIVGPEHLSTTPVFNALLVGYGIPSALLVASAWLLRKSEDGRIRNVIEALACLFSLLTVAILVRHAMNGGVLDDAVPTLGEQAIYTLIAVGASATLMAIDLRRPSIVFRTGSMAAGYVSMISVISAHYVGLNPYFSGETTGAIPVFNLLFLAYLLPGIAYGATAWFARDRRPLHYVMALALTGASLLFAYVSLSVRRVYHGQDISDWKGFQQSELYTYSVVWLVLGVVLLAVGYRFRAKSIRIAAAALVLIAVLKVFLIDMANLEGLFRVLSLMGLGVVLIGIGRFYQTILSGLAGEAPPAAPSATIDGDAPPKAGS